MNSFEEVGIRIDLRGPDQQKTLCPKCSHERVRGKRERCLSVNVPKGVWLCHHCGWEGSLKYEGLEKAVFKPVTFERSEPNERLLGYFKSRGISPEVVERNRISFSTEVYNERPTTIIQFPYFEGDVVYNIKYKWFTLEDAADGSRLRRKHFRQEAGAKPMFYKLNDITPKEVEDVILTEGEEDALSYEQAGLLNAVSIPCGGIQPNSRVGAKLDFIYYYFDLLESKRRFYLSFDADPVGQNTCEEVARRLGKERCWIIRFPEGCKDANDVLVKHGPEKLASCVKEAEPYPIENIVRASAYAERLSRIRESGYEDGIGIGLPTFDKHIRFGTGLPVVITGYSTDGKSNFSDYIKVRLSLRFGIRWAIFSPENFPEETHTHRLVEILIGKTLLPNYQNHMSEDDLDSALAWVEDHFIFVRPDLKKSDFTLDDVLSKFEVIIRRYGATGIEIDPWNAIDHEIDGTETDYIGKSLNRFTRFIQYNNLYGFIVAHPKKPQAIMSRPGRGEELDSLRSNRKYPAATLYDISGSAHWKNKAGYGLVVRRHFNDNGPDTTEVIVEKVKHRHWGELGSVFFSYDINCQRFNPEGYSADRHNWLNGLTTNMAEFAPPTESAVAEFADSEHPY